MLFLTEWYQNPEAFREILEDILNSYNQLDVFIIIIQILIAILVPSAILFFTLKNSKKLHQENIIESNKKHEEILDRTISYYESQVLLAKTHHEAQMKVLKINTDKSNMIRIMLIIYEFLTEFRVMSFSITNKVTKSSLFEVLKKANTFNMTFIPLFKLFKNGMPEMNNLYLKSAELVPIVTYLIGMSNQIGDIPKEKTFELTKNIDIVIDEMGKVLTFIYST